MDDERVGYRRPGTGKVHAGYGVTETGRSPAYMLCGTWAQPLTHQVPLRKLMPEDLCKRCWPSEASSE